MTVGTLLRSMTQSELVYWAALYRIEAKEVQKRG